VKSAEFPVVDGYSRCHSRNSTRDHLSGSLRNALIANAFHVMFTQPATNYFNARCRCHDPSTKANASWSEAAACVKSGDGSLGGGARVN
jgi:hypothetical protein